MSSGSPSLSLSVPRRRKKEPKTSKSSYDIYMSSEDIKLLEPQKFWEVLASKDQARNSKKFCGDISYTAGLGSHHVGWGVCRGACPL